MAGSQQHPNEEVGRLLHCIEGRLVVCLSRDTSVHACTDQDSYRSELIGRMRTATDWALCEFQAMIVEVPPGFNDR